MDDPVRVAAGIEDGYFTGKLIADPLLHSAQQQALVRGDKHQVGVTVHNL